MFSINSLLFVFIGGGTGSLLRFIISKTLRSNFTRINPIATLSSNFLATLLLAFLMYYIHDKSPEIQTSWKFITLTAVCGGFSTFSTFSYETYELFRMNMPIYAILNILISIGLGLFIMFLISRLA